MGCGNSSPTEPPQGGAGGQTEKKKSSPYGQLLEEYSLGKVLGQGSFGVVYLCKKRGTTDEFAVKMIDKVETPVEEIKREAEMLERMAHPSVVKIHKVFYEKLFVCIVMDIYKGGDLIEGMQIHWKTKGKIPIMRMKHVGYQVSHAVAHLHSKSVVHRDVKCDNFLISVKDIVNPACKVYLSDFGTAIEIKAKDRLKETCGTKLYWPPEFFKKNYSFKVDTWAIGVVMYGLVDGRFPFKGEEEVFKKQLKLPVSTPQEVQDLTMSLLQKEEEKRYNAVELCEHSWIKSYLNSSTPSAEETKVSEEDKNWQADEKGLREGGANAVVAERRRELIDRLEGAAAKGQGQSQDGNTQATQFWSPSFQVADRHTGRRVKFEWWKRDKLEQLGILKIDAAKGDASNISKAPVEVIRKMLEDHSIKTDGFGKGSAKTMEDFAMEVQSGSARLMLDATQHKTMVRVVDTCLLRISYGEGANKKYIIESSEKLPDGRARDHARLPGTKKEPHENTRMVALRLIDDMLGMKDCKVELNLRTREVFEEEEDSPSYPGVRTVYRKEIVEGKVTTTDASALKRICLQGEAKFWEYTDSFKITKSFKWMTEKQCKGTGIKMKGPAEAQGVSGLVQTAAGMDEDQLKKYLEENRVDTSKFGQNHTRSLKEFAQEIAEGESALMQSADGGVMRVCDVIVLILKKSDSGEILVEVEEDYDGHDRKQLNQMPGVKKRTDENQFLAAQRILKTQLKIDENSVQLEAKTVKVLEEEKDSPSYPGLKTLYRKRMIQGELVKNA
mmetsp:Transcript_1818/g.4558  ORF Transcript_1818/g.4558 Transcript_1818/m.4558 type:complete len:782 (+) Transcript_1818:74-2419(+)